MSAVFILPAYHRMVRQFFLSNDGYEI
jgi:hypothetical protein